MANHVRHIIVPTTGELAGVIEHHLRVSPAKVADWLRLGAIYRNKRRIFQNETTQAGEYLRVHTRPRRYERPTDLAERILHLDDRLVILDKPTGVPCHATVDNGKENLLSWLSEHLGRPIWITHRLDVPTQGCLVMALSSDAAARFNQLLQRDSLMKTYDAWVEGRCERTGRIQHWMVDDNWAPRQVKDTPFEKSLECLLNIEEADYHEPLDVTRLTIRLLTGRTHQIRVQMAALGHPILGDGMYGSRAPLKEERIALRARDLSFPDPWNRGVERRYQARSDLADPSVFIRPAVFREQQNDTEDPHS